MKRVALFALAALTLAVAACGTNPTAPKADVTAPPTPPPAGSSYAGSST